MTTQRTVVEKTRYAVVRQTNYTYFINLPQTANNHVTKATRIGGASGSDGCMMWREYSLI